MWIIPARAGFTVCFCFCLLDSWDHPRSRGVYILLALKRTLGGGSSPLARGLQKLDALARSARGIIPARAGFTSVGEG